MKSCVDLYSSSADYLDASMNKHRTFEEAEKEIIPDVDYTATLALKRTRKKVINDGDAPEVSLNARDKFRISTFYVIIDNLRAEMSRRGQVYDDIADRFYYMVNVPEISNREREYSECCEELINAYPKHPNSNLFSVLQQFHSYIRHKLSSNKSWNIRFIHTELYKVFG